MSGTKDELIEHVYRQQYDRMKGDVTDAALQTSISRHVITVRREGCKFVEPDVA